MKRCPGHLVPLKGCFVDLGGFRLVKMSRRWLGPCCIDLVQGVHRLVEVEHHQGEPPGSFAGPRGILLQWTVY